MLEEPTQEQINQEIIEARSASLSKKDYALLIKKLTKRVVILEALVKELTATKTKLKTKAIKKPIKKK